MAAIVEERTIAAGPQRVYNALTQQDEIANWWTDDLTVEPEVGSVGIFRFTRWGAGVLQFEIAELEPDAKVRWFSRQGPPAWAGSSVTWQLAPTEGGTALCFTHEGPVLVDGAYETTRGNWHYFLNSLQSYLEMGQGTPGAPASVK